MKYIIFISAIFYYLIITPGFQCGKGEIACENYRTDTILMQIQLQNPAAVFHINDTVTLISSVSDTLSTLSGSVFNTPLSSLKMNVNAYKVVRNINNLYELNYANNEFNAIVHEGSFDNTGGTGFEFLYRRFEPNNTLNVSLLPGREGLYLIQMYHYNYSPSYSYYIYNSSDRCKNYIGLTQLPRVQQQIQFWDSIGTTNLRLANSNFDMAEKRNMNYFFLRVLP